MAAAATVALAAGLVVGVDPGPPAATGDPDGEVGAVPAEPDAPEDQDEQDERWPVGFLGATDTVAVFDDRLDGAVAVDLDSGEHWPLWVPQVAGDQPYRLWRVGDGQLVAGWGTIRTLALTPDGWHVEQLPDATIFVPAAEPDQLWLIDYERGRIDRSGAVTWSLVDATGTVRASIAPDEDDRSAGLEVLRGVPGGLAVRTDDGDLVVYDLDGARHERYLGDAVHLLDVTADQVLWCGEPCDVLHVIDGGAALRGEAGALRGRRAEVQGSADVRGFDPSASWLAPDGRRVVTAVMAEVPGGGVDRQLRVYDTGNGSILALSQVPLGQLRGSWSMDGRQFFFTLSVPPGSGTGAPQQLGRWAVGRGIQQLDVRPHLDGLGQFVAMPRDLVRR